MCVQSSGNPRLYCSHSHSHDTKQIEALFLLLLCACIRRIPLRIFMPQILTIRVEILCVLLFVSHRNEEEIEKASTPLLLLMDGSSMAALPLQKPVSGPETIRLLRTSTARTLKQHPKMTRLLPALHHQAVTPHRHKADKLQTVSHPHAVAVAKMILLNTDMIAVMSPKPPKVILAILTAKVQQIQISARLT